MSAKLRPYTYHGVEFKPVTQGDTNARGDCPFCSHDNPKFYVNLTTGQFDCKHCGRHGNTYTFLSQFHEHHLKETVNAHYKDLANHRRGISWSLFRDHRFALCHADTSHSHWIIPVSSIRNTLVNLRTYHPGRYISSTSGLANHLWRLEHFSGTGPVYLTEGEWDALALERLRRAARAPGTVLSAPGASTFKLDWIPLFQDREVVLCFDHDNAGMEGAERVCELLRNTARSLKILRWPSETADKWDIRDLIHQELDERKTPAKNVWRDFTRMLQVPVHFLSQFGDAPSPLSEDLPKRTSFSRVIQDYRAHYHLDDTMRDGLAIMFAAILSIQLPGDPLWLFIVAPPGSGKTMLLTSMQLSPWTVFKSSLTPKSLISGYRTDEGDPSLIPRLTGKVLILKDYTEITAMCREAQEEIYGILRGAFDGHCEKTFGNGLTRTYPDCHFAMIAGVTDIIYADDRASLGERFLKFQLVESTQVDVTKHILAAITGMANQVENEKHLQRVAASFLNRDLNTDGVKIPQPESWLLDRVIAVAQIISHLRATVPRVGRNDELAYRPSPEVGTRLAKQLVKLGQCLALVYGKPRIDKSCWSLMRRVALDTARGWNLDIFLALADAYPKTLSRETISTQSRISMTTCSRRLENLRLLGAVDYIRLPASHAGHPTYGWSLKPEIAAMWKVVAAS